MKHVDLMRLVPVVIALAIVPAAIVLSVGLPAYALFVGTSIVVAAVSLLGLGVVTGTAGMIALCQLAFAAIGAWVLEFLLLRTPLYEVLGGAAFVVAMLAAGVLTGACGLVVAIPALRLRGVNLAVITLGIAAATEFTLQRTSFPDQWQNQRVIRPFELPFSEAGDRGYFVFAVVVATVLALGVFVLQRGRTGAGWKSVAFSERGTASAGTSVVVAKLSAFGVSAFIGGVSGALVVGQITQVNYLTFQTVNSLGMYVLSIAVGAHLIEMALLGGVLFVLVPEIFKQLHIPLEWANIAFGVLGIQALSSNSNLGSDVRRALARRRRRTRGSSGIDAVLGPREPAGDPPAPLGDPVLEVRGLGVSFGAVRALSGVDLTLHRGEVLGLIGPNGAGKSTFIDALTGFLPAHVGTVELDGVALDGLPPHRIARAGLRRTFQHDRVPASMTIGQYARFITRGGSSARIDDVLDYLGCPASSTPLSMVSVGTRRLIEVAASIAAGPAVLLLDEPAAGLSHDEHLAFADRLRGVPARYGVALIVVEHDLDLVRSACSQLTVLNFGEVLASGRTADVLADPKVVTAYMGETELL